MPKSPGGFAVVVLLHLALLGWLVTAEPTPGPPAAAEMVVELLPAGAATPQSSRPVAQPPRPPAAAAAASRKAGTARPAPADTAAMGMPADDAASAPAPPVTPARFDASYLQNPAPAYPSLARRLGEEGTVLLRVFVEPAGSAGQIEIQAGSGSPRLDQAAVAAVRRWQFVPARRGEEAVGAWVVVPILFNLRG